MNAPIILIENKNKFHNLKFKHTFIARLDGMQCPTMAKLYDHLKHIFELPDYFGKNMDALYDCLVDLEWITQEHVVLIIDHFDQLYSKETKSSELQENLLLLFEEIGRSWQGLDDENLTLKEFNVYIFQSDTVKNILEKNEIEFDLI
jgi:RNAse (barnase) inhibitor barstar